MEKLFSKRTIQRKIRANVSKVLQEISNVDDQHDIYSSQEVSSFDTFNATISVDASSVDGAAKQLVEGSPHTGIESACGYESSVDFDTSFTSSGCLDDETNRKTEFEAASYRGSQEHLADWAVKHNISHVALSELLDFMRAKCPGFPKDPRTLLRTPRLSCVRSVAGGTYCYLGIENAIAKIFETLPVENELELTDVLRLCVNIDGIPLFRSSNMTLWPILGSIKELTNARPFVIAVFCGNSKPSSVDEYVADFIREMKSLEVKNILISNRPFKVVLHAVICDAPARSFLKCIKNHSGYSACERCTTSGKWCGKLTFPDLSASLRTDEDFILQSDSEHHTGVSPFCSLSLGMVSQWPLDYMHLVCLGVMRRMISLWIKGPRSCRLSMSQLAVISGKMKHIRRNIPREFSRKPRALNEVKLWKATEFRLFLLYVGPVVLCGNVSNAVYLNFLSLSFAVRICLSPTLCQSLAGYANQLLKYFIETFETIYGSGQLVYNVHCLIHLTQDVQKYGALDEVSAFKFESYLGFLKKMVRRPQNPVAQIVHRLFEKNECTTVGQTDGPASSIALSKLHASGPVPIKYNDCQQYKQYNTPALFASVSRGDNCVEIDGHIGLVRNIICKHDSNDIFIVFEKFLHLKPFFRQPLPSQTVKVYHASKLPGVHKVYPVSMLSAKYVCIPFKKGYVVFPQIHHG